MKKTLLLVAIFNLLSILTYSQFSVVVRDSVTDGIQFIDNNLHCLPTGFDEVVPAYEVIEITDNNDLTFPAISMTEVTKSNQWFTGAFPTFDYIFPSEIVRQPGDTIIIEFDMFFDIISGSGEAGRLNISLVTGVPEGNAFPGIIFPLAPNFEESPVHFQPWSDFTDGGGGSTTQFGAPAYHLWLFTGSNGPALSYGGSFPRWPGWNSGAGGYYYNRNAGDPGTAVTYSSSDNYPLVPYVKIHSGGPFVSADRWMHYTWMITHEMIHFFVRYTEESPEENREIGFMAIPHNENNISFINEVHGTAATEMPPEYKWYERFNALRFYFYSHDRDIYMSNLEITKTGRPAGTFAEFQTRPVSQRRPMADAGSYDLPLFLYNGVEGEEITAKVTLAKGDPGHIDGFEEGNVVFTNPSSELTTASLPLTLTDMYMSENDTLLFEITNVSGGVFPAVGQNRFFQLIIRSSGAQPSNIDQMDIKAIEVWPNPAQNAIQIKNPGHLKIQAIEIIDITGKITQRKNMENSKTIDISGLQNGIYFLRIISDNGLITRRFVKQ